MDRPQNKPIPDIDFPLRKTFGKDAFRYARPSTTSTSYPDSPRPYQREIIIAALQGHDVFVQAATSFGKSLCYQLPAILDHGITIVISPLLALMNDQVTALLAASIPAATINSKTPIPARDAILNDLKCGHPTTRLLYITPEFSQSASFRAHLATVYAQREFARLAIDEAQ
jgi:superfamily II DNA helicase RecQ